MYAAGRCAKPLITLLSLTRSAKQISTGLDSATTFEICRRLRALCQTVHATVVVSLLQVRWAGWWEVAAVSGWEHDRACHNRGAPVGGGWVIGMGSGDGWWW